MAKPKHAWMIRAGNDNLLADQVEEKGAIAIGWAEMGDLSNLKTREQFKLHYREIYTEGAKGSVPVNAGQVFNFTRVVESGDYLVTYEKATRDIIIGVANGNYEYNSSVFGEGYPQIRRVNWLKRVPRDAFSQAARNSMGSTLTVFRLDDHLDEIDVAATQQTIEPISTPTSEEEPPFYEDVKSRADELISDIVSNLDPYQFQDLVAGVLRAMGFYATSSPPGRDRGIDIVATRDALGLQEPRMKVQVKHRGNAASGEEMRAFLTASQSYDPLFVSTGGFSADARFEAERAGRAVSLMDRDGFIALLLEHYDSLEQESKALVPLVRIWVPVGK